MGYEAVQISAVSDITPEPVRVYRDACSELGLEIALSHANFARLSERLDWVWGITACGTAGRDRLHTLGVPRG